MMFGKRKAEPEPAVRDILLHCHLFKNAGTTIDDALARSFRKGFLDHREDMKMRKQRMPFVADLLEARQKLRAVSSHHMPFDPGFTHDDFRFRFVVMLREPLDRAGSVHAFEVKQKSGSRGADMAAKVDIGEYFDWRLDRVSPAVLRSFHVRYLSGLMRPRLDVEDEHYETARQRLHADEVSFGLVDRFDESMVVMEHELAADFPELDLAHVVRNRNRVGSSKERVEELRRHLGEERFARLQEANRFDTALYEEANRELDRKIGAIAGFPAKLEDYRRRCEALS